MRAIKLIERRIRILACLLALLFIACIALSAIFTIDFVAKNIDSDHRIGEHVRERIGIFQSQVRALGIVFLAAAALLFVFARRIAAWSGLKNLLLNLALLCIVLVIMALLAETALRVGFGQKIRDEFGSGPGGLAFQQGVQRNSLGFRDVEHAQEKQEGVFRILITGDSFTAGQGIRNPDNVYPRLLQKKLDEAYGEGKFEVINLALEGYSTLDEYEAIEDKGLALSPDLLIVGYYSNDAEGTGSRIGFERLYYHHFAWPWELGSWLYSHSYAYYFFESRLKGVLARFDSSQSYERYVRHLYSDSNPFFARHKSYLAGLVRLGADRGIPVIVMGIPEITDFSSYPFGFVDEYVSDITRPSGGHFLGLRDAFSLHDPEDLRASFTDSHMNELGNRITAETLFNYLQASNLLSHGKKQVASG